MRGDILKDKIIKFRVNSDEIEFIKQKAKSLNMSVSKYVLKSALEKEIIIIPEIKEFRVELRKIGNNLNQMTTLANMGKSQFFNLEETYKGISEIWQSLNLLRKNLHHKNH